MRRVSSRFAAIFLAIVSISSCVCCSACVIILSGVEIAAFLCWKALACLNIVISLDAFRLNSNLLIFCVNLLVMDSTLLVMRWLAISASKLFLPQALSAQRVVAIPQAVMHRGTAGKLLACALLLAVAVATQEAPESYLALGAQTADIDSIQQEAQLLQAEAQEPAPEAGNADVDAPNPQWQQIDVWPYPQHVTPKGQNPLLVDPNAFEFSVQSNKLDSDDSALLSRAIDRYSQLLFPPAPTKQPFVYRSNIFANRINHTNPTAGIPGTLSSLQISITSLVKVDLVVGANVRDCFFVSSLIICA